MTELLTITPELNEEGLTGRYKVTLSDATFTMTWDGKWTSPDLPEGIDPDLITWVGKEIEKL